MRFEVALKEFGKEMKISIFFFIKVYLFKKMRYGDDLGSLKKVLIMFF